MSLTSILAAMNSLLEDSCVLVAAAYLLTRGRTLELLLPPEGRDYTHRQAIAVGVILGVIGASEYLWPGYRFPYVTPTLFIAFAAWLGGFRVGTIAAVTLCMLSVVRTLIIRESDLPIAVALSSAATIAVTLLLRRISREDILWLPLLTGAGTQTAASLVYSRFYALTVPRAMESISANGIGMVLLLLVVREAVLRTKAEQLQIQAAKSENLALLHQLDALRARIHPHFLFNTLSAVAALCSLDPEKAEYATIRLGDLMRRALEGGGTAPVALADEIAAVKGYLEIEGLRLNDRLQVRWQADDPIATSTTLRLPSFSLLTLVENSVIHGISRRPEGGLITITARHGKDGSLLVAVLDNGPGMTSARRREVLQPDAERLHGLYILNQQLCLTYGTQARIRLFSAPDHGTLVAFRLKGSRVR